MFFHPMDEMASSVPETPASSPYLWNVATLDRHTMPDSFRFSLDALQVFESAARLGSFKAAATELSVTPTAVSHRIRALEEALGCALFHRPVRAITLTPEGEQLQAEVSHGLQEIDIRRNKQQTVPYSKRTVSYSRSPCRRFRSGHWLWVASSVGGASYCRAFAFFPKPAP